MHDKESYDMGYKHGWSAGSHLVVYVMLVVMAVVVIVAR